MTRRLELEKRRLQRIEKELAAARKTYQVRIVGDRPHTARASSRTKPDQWRRIRADTSGSQTCRSYQSGQTCIHSNGEVEDTVIVGGSSASNALTAPMKALLNRLEVQTKKLDRMNHDNTSLREEVDATRRRRLQLDSIFEKLKHDIRERTAQLQDFVEETTASRQVHDHAEQRVGVMKKRMDFERKLFKQEVLRLREQLKLQDWERKEVEVQLKRSETGVQKKKELIVPDEERAFCEGDMMRRIIKNAFLNCIQRRHIKQHQKAIEVFEQAFSTIKQTTGIEHIEEIVKIFVNLESRNYSLLTYVNVMNREIESLEGIRRERRLAEMTRHQAEERHERARYQALADIQRHWHSSQEAMRDCQSECSKMDMLIEELIPHLLDITRRLEQEFSGFRSSSGALEGHGEDLLACKLPSELREETLPEWLEWVETALGRFRDLLPGEKDTAFPCTAQGQVKGLTPKRLGGHAPPQALVKTQELPTAVSLVVDENGNPIAKRVHAAMTAAQKAEMLDEESEEEDFENRPLPLKDLKTLAEKSATRRKRRGKDKREVFSGTNYAAQAQAKTRQSLSMTSTGELNTSAPRVHSPTALSSEPIVLEKDEEVEEDEEEEEKSNAEAEFRTDMESVATTTFDAGRNEDTDDQQALQANKQLKRGKNLTAPVDKEMADVSEKELKTCFLRRYNMTRDELQSMADHLHIHPSNLCFLKQEFDAFDQDQSGYIDTRELKSLLKKLGEDLTDEGLDRAFKVLDSDGSGEIEFFEFAEWFTSTE
eukprot:CAMPEP_0169323548 /NCGR_PEP_ID=MMETSP1017-20121227/10009_1 /TAXON_ID=342587 /ORGANISM="Karlodinium micrum, Strain CCMP2283" /LENGTH=768 /DNA_ID=CAMNT_0009418159 /DNA_START=58 /DNA_END=2365 /DNA_ORIENTATION=-